MSETLITACANLGQAQQNHIIQPSNGQKDLLGAGKLTIKEAAKVLRMGATSLRRLIYKGEIHAIRIGAKILLLESDVEVFLQGHYGSFQPRLYQRKDKLPPRPRHVIESEHLK